jgi:carbamoyl-phosphate synthase large subunit
MKNVLITSAGKRVVLVKIFQNSFRELGYDSKIYTTDIKPGMAPAGIQSDGCFSVPRSNEKYFIDSILKICKENNIGVIIPTIDPELIVFSENRQRFSEIGVELMLSDSDIIRVCRDKRKTNAFFTQIGINVPKEIDKHHPVFPMFAKPYDGSLSTNIHIIKNEDALTNEILEDEKLIFMEYIDKNEYKEFTVDMYFGKDHKVKSIVPRERIEIRAGEINKGITRKNYIVEFLKQHMGYCYGIRGCICVQLFYRESDNDIKGIEINPRFGGGYPLSFYAKANYADFVIREYLLKEEIDYTEDWLDNTMMLRYDKDIIIHENRVVAFDLDDTLYKEVDYLKSAFYEIAHTLQIEDTAQNVYDFLWSVWNKKGDPFGELIEYYGLSITKEELIAMYHEHVPSISLDSDVIKVLNFLKNKGIALCLVTDGRSLTQRNKIKALELNEFFSNDCIFISEEVGCDKRSSRVFDLIEVKFPNSIKYYVGDNQLKDFYWPNRLGWNTICLKNDGRNIHEPKEVQYPYTPKQEITSFIDLLDIVDWKINIRNGMIKKIAIYGAGGLGREVAGGIQRINNAGRQQWEIIGFFDDNIPVGTQVSHFGEVLGGINELNSFSEPLALAIAVGATKTRKQIHDRISNPNISFPNLIAPSFRVLDRQTFEIGEGNIIQDNCSVTCDVKIGSFNVFNGSNALGHDVKVGDFNVLMPGVRLSGEVKLGTCNLLGVDSIVLQRVKIGDNVTLGAGSVMMTKPKDGFTYIGVPAKKFDFE